MIPEMLLIKFHPNFYPVMRRTGQKLFVFSTISTYWSTGLAHLKKFLPPIYKKLQFEYFHHVSHLNLIFIYFHLARHFDPFLYFWEKSISWSDSSCLVIISIVIFENCLKQNRCSKYMVNHCDLIALKWLMNRIN